MWTEEEKGTIDWEELDVVEMTFKMMGDLTFVGLREQTFDKWFGKVLGPDFTEETKGTISWTEESKE